jgi:protein subunit release factor A
MDQEGLVVKKRLPTVMLEVGAGGEEASLVPGETTSHYKKYVDLRPFIFVTELSQYFIYDDSMTKNGSSKTERQ